MHHRHRALYVIWFICLLFIIVACLVRISENPIDGSPTLSLSPSEKSPSDLKTDPSFYEKSVQAILKLQPQLISQQVEQVKNIFSPAPKNPTPVKTAPMVPPSMPQVTARAYLVGNAQSGQVYLERDSSQRFPVASMSKLVTAFAITDSMGTQKSITITPDETNVPADGSHLMAGETYTIADLLYPMLLNSSNVAAEALASSTNRQKFIELMSSYAWEVGMPHTYFADPTGLSAQNQATAQDMFALARYLYTSRQDILAITRTSERDVATTTEHGAHQFTSIHPFVHDPDFLGGKTGHTPEAGDTMMTILKINGQPIVFIILAAQDGARAGDTSELIAEYKRRFTKSTNE